MSDEGNCSFTPCSGNGADDTPTGGSADDDSNTGQGTGSASADDTVGDPSSADGPNCNDEDGDGYGDGCAQGEDCDDDDPDINPSAAEACDDIDQNCDGDPMAGCECADDGVSGNCNMPTDMGTLNVGESKPGVVGNVPTDGGIDWYKISFPLADVRPGLGTPTLSFAVNEGDAFVFDVVYDQCGGDGMPCGMGGDVGGLAIGLTEWTFVDDDPGCCTAPMDSMVPWPATIYIRVQRTTTGSSCATYQLQASR